MIKIDKSFSIKPYAFGWELHHTKPSTGKRGVSTTITYHPNLLFVSKAIIDKKAGECKTAESIVEAIEKSTKKLAKKLKEAK